MVERKDRSMYIWMHEREREMAVERRWARRELSKRHIFLSVSLVSLCVGERIGGDVLLSHENTLENIDESRRRTRTRAFATLYGVSRLVKKRIRILFIAFAGLPSTRDHHPPFRTVNETYKRRKSRPIAFNYRDIY